MKAVGKLKYVRSCMVVGSIVVAMLITETVLRAANISYPVFHTFDYERGRALEPRKEGWYRGEGETYIRINQEGFRDREHTFQKPKGTYRIAVLGDSYTEARAVALKDAYWKKLEGHLQACKRFSSQEVEVLSFGVTGYGTAEELLTLRHKAWAYDPDLVLTQFFSGNDLLDNFPLANPNEVERIPRPYFYLDKSELKLDLSFRAWTPKLLGYRLLLFGVHHLRTLELLNTSKRVVNGWRMKQSAEFAFRETGLSEWVYAPPQTPLLRNAWAVTEAGLALMHKEVIEQGAQFLLFAVTSPNQVDLEQRRIVQSRLRVEALDYPEKRLTALGEREGFSVLNLLYDFQRYADQHNTYLHGFPNTKLGAGHWNEKGHDLAATLIAKRICDDAAFH